MIITTVLFQGALAFVGGLMVACFLGVAVVPWFDRRDPLTRQVAARPRG